MEYNFEQAVADGVNVDALTDRGRAGVFERPSNMVANS
jgi:hypothetical protein